LLEFSGNNNTDFGLNKTENNHETPAFCQAHHILLRSVGSFPFFTRSARLKVWSL
jgi:hypothetical protein